MSVAATSGARMVVYTPADEICRAAIDSLISGTGRAGRFPCWPAHERSA